MPCRLDRAGDGGDVVHHARGGIDLHGEDRLDLAVPVRLEARRDIGGIDGAPPVALEDLDLATQSGRHVAPAPGETAAFEHQHLVALRQHVAERGLPCAVAVGNVDIDAGPGAKDAGEIAEQTVGELHQGPGVDVDRGTVHRAQHFVGDRGRPRNYEELAPRSHRHVLRP